MITKDIVETLAVQSGAVVGVTYITDTDHDMTHFTPSELLAFANAIAAYQREHSASISAFEQAALQKEVAELRKQLASHEALLAEETKQHECWLFNAQALQKSYNELDKKHREEVEVLNLRVAQTTAALVTTNELLHNLAVLATHEANKQGE